MKRVEFRIDEKLDHELAVAAAQEDTSKAALVREVLVAKYGASADGTDALMHTRGMLKGSRNDVELQP